LEGVGDAVQELENAEGLRVDGAGAQEEQLVVDERVEEGGRIGGGQVDERRAGFGVGEEQREEGARRRRAREGLLVLVENIEGFDGAHGASASPA
jgi:hypothetical protein